MYTTFLANINTEFIKTNINLITLKFVSEQIKKRKNVKREAIDIISDIYALSIGFRLFCLVLKIAAIHINIGYNCINCLKYH